MILRWFTCADCDVTWREAESAGHCWLCGGAGKADWQMPMPGAATWSPALESA